MKSHYNAKGYVIVPKVLAPSDCAAIVSVAKLHASFDFAPIIDLEKKAEYLTEIVIHDPQIVGHVQDILEGPVKSVGSMFHFKEPGTPYAKQAWSPHQDNSYLQCDYGLSVSAILALADTDKGNGGLYVYEGTHKLPLQEFEPSPTFGNDGPGNRVNVARMKKKDLTFRKGDLYIQHGNLIHGSYANLSNRSRPHYGIIYVTLYAKYKLGKARKAQCAN